MNKDAGWAIGPNGERVAAVQIGNGMNLPPLPELPKTPNILGQMAVPDAFTADQLRSYALSYGRAVVEACAMEVEAVGPKEGPLKLISEGFAAAIRNGVIREGEGNATHHASDAD